MRLKLISIVLLVPAWMWSQAITTASLSGTVTDPTGASIPGVEVVAKNLATQVEYTAKTNELGVYRLLNLPPASYDISATAPGFQKVIQSNVQLFVNQSSTQDFRMQVGTVDQQVEVTGLAPTLQTGTASLGTVIDSSKVVDLPLNGRQFTQLMLLAPGVSPIAQNQDNTPTIGTRGSQLSNSGFVPSVNGQPSRSNMFFVDGIIDSDPFFSSFAIAPSVDIIQEFNIESHNDTAEVGQVVGGIVNVVSKSGSEKLHGTAYEFNRNKAVEARNFFAPQNRPNFNQNQFGFTVGGPIPFWKFKENTWFFGGYEGYRFTRGTTIFSRVPNEAEWNGDFSAFLGAEVGTDTLGRPIRQGQIFSPFTGRDTTAGAVDPVTGRAAIRTGFVREPFPGNRVPSSMFNPIVAWKRWVPAPNLTATPGSLAPNYLNTQSATTNLDSYNIRVDRRLGANDMIYGRFLFNNTEGLTPAALPTAPSISTRNFRNVGVHWVHNFGPTAVLDTRFGFQHGNAPGFTLQPDDREQLFADAGFDRPDSAFILGAGGGLRQFPSIGVSDFAGTGSSSGAAFDPQQIYQFAGDFTKISGRHTIKAGAIWFKVSTFHFGACPSVSFSRVPTNDNSNLTTTGNGLASFLLGVPSGGLVYSGYVGATLNTNIMGVYAQDSIKITPKLTLNIGIRWDYSQPPIEENDALAAFDQATAKYVISGSTPPPDCATTGGNPPCIPGGGLPENVVMFGKRGIINPVRDNLAPRVGFAYRLTDRTVIRGGFGMFYDNWAFLLQNTQDPRGGWPFGLIRGPRPGVNERAVEVMAQNVVPRVSSPPATPFPAGRRVNDTEYKNGYIAAWNVDVQQQITNTLTVTGGYVASRGHRTNTGFLQNTALRPGPGPIQDRVPFPLLVPAAFGNRSNGRSWYDSFQFKAEQRLHSGLSFLVSYTWQKSMDLGCSGFAGIEGCPIQNPNNIWLEKSVSGHDIPHRIAVGYLWELPFGKNKPYLNQGVARHIFGNWQINGIVDSYSGQPVTIQTGFDTPNTGTNAARPDQIGNPIPEQNRDHLNWFSRSAFVAGPDCRVVPESQCRYGTLGRNTQRGPGFFNLDFSVFRDFPITERWGAIQLRFEFFNILNHANFLASGFNSGMALSSATFGQLLVASPARQIQFAGKWIF